MSATAVFPFAYLSDEMLEQIRLDDGRIDEWQELVGEPAMTLLDFQEDRGRGPDPSDLDFRIWLAWHDDPARLYVAFVASDDVYDNTHDYSVDWFGSSRDNMMWSDCIMMGFDGDHSGGAGCTNDGIAHRRIGRRLMGRLSGTRRLPAPPPARFWMTWPPDTRRGSFLGRSCLPTGKEAAAWPEKRPSSA